MNVSSLLLWFAYSLLNYAVTNIKPFSFKEFKNNKYILKYILCISITYLYKYQQCLRIKSKAYFIQIKPEFPFPCWSSIFIDEKCQGMNGGPSSRPRGTAPKIETITQHFQQGPPLGPFNQLPITYLSSPPPPAGKKWVSYLDSPIVKQIIHCFPILLSQGL